MNRLAALAVSVLFFVAVSQATWTIVQKDLATIAFATSFYGPTSGFVAGGTSGLQPLFLNTVNGGQNFTNEGMADDQDGAFLSIRMGSPTWGVAGALGFIELPCGAFTVDGKTWNNIDKEFALLCAFQGAAIVNDGKTAVLIGSFSDRRDWKGNGVKITTNSGSSWDQHNSNFLTTPVRYGDFISADLGYVTGGIWPEESAPKSLVEREILGKFPLTRHLTADLKTKQVHYNKPSASDAAVPGYVALLSKVTNSGKTWSLLVNQTNQGLYFNEISCIDQNNCWAVLEGVDSVLNDTAQVWYTSNGWQTWSVQLTVPGGSLVAIDMQSATYGWAVGALVQGDVTGDFDAIFYVTRDGKTWTLDSTIKNFFPMDVSAPDTTHAYAAGITPVGLSSFAALQ